MLTEFLIDHCLIPASLMSEAEYHAHPALSSTIVKELLSRTPAHALHRAQTPLDSDAVVVGSALHCRVLRPEAFANEFVIAPTADRRTKAGKEAFAAAEADAVAKGATILTASQAADVERMRAAIAEHPFASDLLARAEAREYNAFGAICDVPVRARVDAIGGGVMVDLKTTSSGTSASAIARSAADFGWAVQVAFYTRVLQSAGYDPVPDWEACYFIVVEKTAPHFVRVVSINPDDIAAVDQQIDRAVETYRDCMRTNEWPEWPAETEIRLPGWYLDSIGGAA